MHNYPQVTHSWQEHDFQKSFFIYRIFRPITRALSIQKGSEIVKNEHARYTLEWFPTDNARVICTKKVSENTVLCIKQLSIEACLFYPFRCVIKSRYSSPVDHRSLDDLWPQITRWSVHKYIHNVTKVTCALYVRCALSVRKYGTWFYLPPCLHRYQY